MPLELMYITNSSEIAKVAENAGVDRIWIDLEKLGKELRQPGDTVKSDHSIEDIVKVKNVLKKSKLQVRINPINKNSSEEIDNVIEAGAEIIMLPYFKTKEEVEYFISCVHGRVVTNILVETKQAYENLDDILEISGIDEMHVGLNDLHISYGKKFMFELLADGTVEKIATKALEKKIPFGFGGISKIGDGMLSSEKIIAEHYRLGSTRAILSRGFIDKNIALINLLKFEREFCNNVHLIREFENKLSLNDYEYFLENKLQVQKIVKEIVGRG